jgi:hypothetical protein
MSAVLDVSDEILDEIAMRAQANIAGAEAVGWKPSLVVYADKGPYMMLSPWVVQAMIDEIREGRTGVRQR